MADKCICKRSFRETAVPGSAAMLALAGPILIGLMIPVHSVAQASVGEKSNGQSGERNLEFEVASIRHADPNRGGIGQPLTYSPGRYIGEKVSLSLLAWNAYGIKEAYQIEWASGWMVSELYDLAAKVPDGATIEQVHVMLQHLLAERFGLVVHREARQLPGFRLVVAKGRAKLRRSVDAPASPEASGQNIVNKNGILQFTSSARSGLRLTLAEEMLHGRRETMSGLSHWLVAALHTPVIDGTGIEGEYDYDLAFAPPEGPPSSKRECGLSSSWRRRSGAREPGAFRRSSDALYRH